MPHVTLHSAQEPNFQKKTDEGMSLSSETFRLMVYSYRTPGLVSWKRSCDTKCNVWQILTLTHKGTCSCLLNIPRRDRYTEDNIFIYWPISTVCHPNSTKSCNSEIQRHRQRPCSTRCMVLQRVLTAFPYFSLYCIHTFLWWLLNACFHQQATNMTLKFS